MKKRIVKRILSTALAASMILGNIGIPQGLGNVRAEEVDIDSIVSGKTKVTDEEINDLYRKVTYTPQAVHDPSIIKGQDGQWYVFGSHRGAAKTSDLRNWENVNAESLFGDGSGNVLAPEAAFVNSLYTGTIQVAGAAATTMSVENSALTNDTAGEIPVSEAVSEPEEETVSEPEAVSEEEAVSEVTSEEETATEPETTSEEETAAEPEEVSGEAEITESETAFIENSEENAGVSAEVYPEERTVTGSEESAEENSSVGSDGLPVDNDAEAGTELPSAEMPAESDVEEEPSVEEVPEETEEVSTEEVSVEDSAAESVESVVTADFSIDAEAIEDAVNAAIVNDGAGSVAFGKFDAHAWCTASDGWAIIDKNGGTNMWAPDIIYNTSMNKYCMYLSLNGQYHNSVVILLTADNIEGPYAYQGPIVYSGFTAQEGVPTNYKKTDMKYVFGESYELDDRYKHITNVVVNEAGKITDAKDLWGDYWPHAIDPAVFYDAAGNLWMIYGSWSGGIYSLQLDEATGLRDYTISYESDYDSKGQSVTSDPYFGKKIAGGYYNSGEGPYIEKIGDYYYLFMSYGFYAPNGGYSMRIFRSENPDGPYVDTNGISAIYEKGIANFVASYAQDVSQIDTRGMRLMTYYKWDHMSKGEVAQGHNSAIVDDDGRAYVIYHTKFNDNTAAHELRVHELFQNKNGWILASPFAFANDEALDYNTSPTDVAGDYEILVGDYSLGYDKNSGDGDQGGTYTGPLAEIVTYTLTADNKIQKGGQDVGTWSVVSGKAYADLIIDGKTYSGVFAEVTKDSAGIKTLCFTGVDESTGITLWGAKKLSGKTLIADNVINPA
ncbi:MAG: glycoside hydrolase family 43 protein, partial [Lachnospiraceae bacterium]|nr:glycoside hydrolase family 43 protein [Lachnospiraceae bacterium]